MPGDGRLVERQPGHDVSNEPRDPHGRWTSGASSSDYASDEPSAAEKAKHVAAVFELNSAGKAAAKEAGRTPLTFHQLNEAGSGRFHDAIAAAKKQLEFGASVHVYDADEYKATKMFVTPDNKAGFALKPNGDIVSAFSNSKASRAGDSILALAVQQGGRRLDAFDTVLPKIYSQNGFRAVARLDWNEEYKPGDWDKKTFKHFNGGEPDVVFMVYDPENAKLYKPGDGKRVTSYEAGVAAQDKALEKISKGREHPGAGYSAESYVDKHGVIQTNSVYDAQRALFENRRVELKQVKQISTLIKRLGETAAEMSEHGETPPTFNLCLVTVKGTNLFCADQIGIPRVEMPVIKASKTKDFITYLKKQGYGIEKGYEKAANLRATQSEISGVKVAAQMARIKDRGFYKRLVVSRDDYILDGHHTWAGQLGLDAKDNRLDNDKNVKIARVDISITKLLAEAEKWTGGKGKKPASEAPKGFQFITMRQARDVLDEETYRKFADQAVRFGQLDFDNILVTVPKVETRLSDHTDWMNTCVPQMMGYGKSQDVAIAACMNMWRDAWEETHPDGKPDPGPPRPEKEWDESKHPRDPAGTSTGGQFTSGGGTEPSSSDDDCPNCDPNVIAVGGDEWNKATAKRLEREYQQAKPKLEELTKKAGGKDEDERTEDEKVGEEGTEPDEEEEPPYIPESWDEMTEDQQSAAKDAFLDQKKQGYIESEQQSWYDNGGANDEAKSVVASEYSSGYETDWAKDAIADVRVERADAGLSLIPYNEGQLLKAIDIDYESNGEGTGDLKIEFNEAELMEPEGYDPNQQMLPGFPKEDPSQRLTEKMRDELIAAIEKAFDKAADQKNPDPPDYLEEQAVEYMEMDWDDNMSDKQKFDFVKEETSIIDDSKEYGSSSAYTVTQESIPGVPERYDPLNKTSGTDYRKTQWLAHRLSIQRAEQVFEERGIKLGAGVDAIQALSRLDNELWDNWKSSSTTMDGQLLQVAAAEELGGRLNPTTGHGGKVQLDVKILKEYADDGRKSIGGYEGVKAYIRAKWETTQFLLDKAGIKTLELYRGIALYGATHAQAVREKRIKQMVGGFSKVPNLNVVRNGLASTTVNPDVANGWSSSDARVVLRAEIPRTAAVSVPAYGINIKSEQEVVVAGTAWKAWDAWLGQAPRFKDQPVAA